MFNMYNDANVPSDDGLHWKQDLRRQFEDWLAGLDSNPDEPENDIKEPPDLYSFFQELSALRMESMKTARRTTESYSSFQQVLSEIESSIQQTNRRFSQAAISRESDMLEMQKAQIRPFVDLYIRLERLFDKGFNEPLKSGFWPVPKTWKDGWRNQNQGLQIVMQHFWSLLENQGVSPIATVGHDFDPALMMAVAAEESGHLPPNQVIDEISPGYLFKGALLKTAEVKVAKLKI